MENPDTVSPMQEHVQHWATAGGSCSSSLKGTFERLVFWAQRLSSVINGWGAQHCFLPLLTERAVWWPPASAVDSPRALALQETEGSSRLPSKRNKGTTRRGGRRTAKSPAQSHVPDSFVSTSDGKHQTGVKRGCSLQTPACDRTGLSNWRGARELGATSTRGAAPGTSTGYTSHP
eukprot:1615814-Pyramimonas_sp.AAC.3